MEEVTYSIELSDGTMLNNLRLNGNNYVSETEVTEAEFAGRLSRVIIRSSDTEEILNDAELLQIVHYSDGWYFILREIPEDLNDAGKRRRDGKEWLLSHIYRILHNYTYIGQVRYKGNIYDGEQEAIISKEVWDKAQEMLKEADPLKGTRLTSRQETVVLLRDLVRCGHCGCAMGSNYTRKKNNRKYVYYICIQDTKKARKTCPVSRVPGGDLEQVVLEQIQRLLLTPQVQAQLICDDLDADTVKRYTSQFSEIWQEIFPVAQYQILHLLVEKITVFEDHLDVELKTSYLKDLIKDLKNGTN